MTPKSDALVLTMPNRNASAKLLNIATNIPNPSDDKEFEPFQAAWSRIV